MTELSLLKEEMTKLVKSCGLEALSAFPGTARKQYIAPVVVVSIKEFQSDAAGFQNYLGERFSQERMEWEELYGRKTKVLFGLDIYSPRRYGERGCQEGMEQLAQLLQKQAPLGLPVTCFSWGKIQYDRSCDLFCRTGEVLCEGNLYAVMDTDGSFLSFEVRGGITLE